MTCNDAKRTKLHSSALNNAFGQKLNLATSSNGFDAVAFAYDSMKEVRTELRYGLERTLSLSPDA